MTSPGASNSRSDEPARVDVSSLFRAEAIAARRRLPPFKPPLVSRALILVGGLYLLVAIGVMVLAAGALAAHRI